ncbi:uncharacterized protein V1518DRAFT_139101 [Limtongia smithiae]|uniref:uncharacterized protein n=1 Tax=Limtongia smithiae TaxID=1125753 RepID=UPI0034CF8F01
MGSQPAVAPARHPPADRPVQVLPPNTAPPSTSPPLQQPALPAGSSSASKKKKKKRKGGVPALIHDDTAYLATASADAMSNGSAAPADSALLHEQYQLPFDPASPLHGPPADAHAPAAHYPDDDPTDDDDRGSNNTAELQKKSKKKKKKKSASAAAAQATTSTGAFPPVARKPDRIWNTNTAEERERIKDFWLSLGEDERRSLVKVEKEAVLRKMKEQQKPDCDCSVCGRKRSAIEKELEVLYDAYYEELEQYANQQQKFGPVPPPLLRPACTPASRRIQDAAAYIDDEDDNLDDDYDYSESEDPDMLTHDAGRRDFFNFGNSLTVQGGILTVAEDLLKNDGKKFIEMMEQLARQRMRREKAASTILEYDDDDDYGDDDEDDEEYDEDDEDDENDCMSDEQRMEEGRRMFQIFAARMFEQRVLTAYREKISQERQQKLLEELDEENRQKEEREMKKAKEKERKKDKKRQQKQAKEEERLKREQEKAAEEELLRAAELKKHEEARKRKEEQKLKKEAERRAVEEERQRKEEDRRRRQQEEREREAERDRKKKEREEKERHAREEQARKEREVKERERKELEARELREKRERAELEQRAKLELERRRQQEEAARLELLRRQQLEKEMRERELKDREARARKDQLQRDRYAKRVQVQQQQLQQQSQQVRQPDPQQAPPPQQLPSTLQQQAHAAQLLYTQQAFLAPLSQLPQPSSAHFQSQPQLHSSAFASVLTPPGISAASAASPRSAIAPPIAPPPNVAAPGRPGSVSFSPSKSALGLSSSSSSSPPTQVPVQGPILNRPPFVNDMNAPSSVPPISLGLYGNSLGQNGITPTYRGFPTPLASAAPFGKTVQQQQQQQQQQQAQQQPQQQPRPQSIQTRPFGILDYTNSPAQVSPFGFALSGGRTPGTPLGMAQGAVPAPGLGAPGLGAPGLGAPGLSAPGLTSSPSAASVTSATENTTISPLSSAPTSVTTSDKRASVTGFEALGGGLSAINGPTPPSPKAKPITRPHPIQRPSSNTSRSDADAVPHGTSASTAASLLPDEDVAEAMSVMGSRALYQDDEDTMVYQPSARRPVPGAPGDFGGLVNGTGTSVSGHSNSAGGSVSNGAAASLSFAHSAWFPSSYADSLLPSTRPSGADATTPSSVTAGFDTSQWNFGIGANGSTGIRPWGIGTPLTNSISVWNDGSTVDPKK